MTLLEKYIAKVEEMRKTPLNEERESVAEIHNAALDEVQSLLPELIKEVRDDLQKDMRIRMREWHGTGPAMVDDYFASFAEPNIK